MSSVNQTPENHPHCEHGHLLSQPEKLQLRNWNYIYCLNESF